MIRSADERLADYLSRLDRTDAEEDGASGRPAKNLTEKIAALKERKTRHEGLLKELERSGESQVSLTDPDSRASSTAISSPTRPATVFPLSAAVSVSMTSPPATCPMMNETKS